MGCCEAGLGLAQIVPECQDRPGVEWAGNASEGMAGEVGRVRLRCGMAGESGPVAARRVCCGGAGEALCGLIGTASTVESGGVRCGWYSWVVGRQVRQDWCV